MELVAGLSVAFLLLCALFIATKTFALWRRTRELPELLLGAYLSCATVLGYPLAIASTLIPASEMWPLHAAYTLVMNLGFACLLFFTLRVFRANVFWASCLAGAVLVVLAVSSGMYIAEATSESPRGPTEMIGLSLLNSSGIGLVYFWTTAESLVCHRRLRLQMRLGLADVLVANRVLLWGLMTLAAGIAVIANAASMLGGSFMSPLMVLVSSALGVVHATCLFLAFHPPAWYRSWVEQRSVAEAH